MHIRALKSLSKMIAGKKKQMAPMELYLDMD